MRSLYITNTVLSSIFGLLLSVEAICAEGLIVRGNVLLDNNPTKTMIERGYADERSKGLQWAVICLESVDDRPTKPESAEFTFTQSGITPHMAFCNAEGKVSMINRRKEAVFVQMSGFEIRKSGVLKTASELVADIGKEERNPIEVSGFSGADVAFAIPVKTKYAAFSDKMGNFQINDVPAGDYILRLQHVSLKRSSFGKANGQAIRVGDVPVLEIPTIAVNAVQ